MIDPSQVEAEHGKAVNSLLFNTFVFMQLVKRNP